MEPLTNTLTQEQQLEISAEFESQYGLSLETLQARLEEKVQAEPAFEQNFAKSPAQHVKQMIETETGKELPEGFVTKFEQGMQKMQDNQSQELTDDELEQVSGGLVVLSLGALALLTCGAGAAGTGIGLGIGALISKIRD
jgi:bacteriocin-like protein